MMQIMMTPGLCSSEYSPTSGSFCESCFARFLTRPGQTELPCFTAMHDDGAEQQTLVLSYGSYQERIVLTEPERERLAYGDWRGWEEWIARIPA
jgi:hypothetical protein